MNLSRKISVIVIVSVLIASLSSLLAYYHYSKQTLLISELDKLQSESYATISNYENFMYLASPSLDALSRLLTSELTQPFLEKPAETFASRIMQFDDGVWRNDRQNYNGLQQAGIFIPADIQLTQQSEQFYCAALDVFDSFGLSATSNPVFNNIWMLGRDRSEIIFDRSYPDFVYSMPAETDYTSTPWMTLVSPENNPKRQLMWTPTLFDPVSKSWMVSALLPLDLNGEWIATLGIDVGLDRLFSLLYSQSDEYADEQHFVVDNKGDFILAGAWQQQLQLSPERFQLNEEEYELKAMIAEDLSIDLQILSPVESQGVEYQVIAAMIMPNGWKYFRLIPTAEILKPLQSNVLNVAALIVLTVIMLGLFINLAVRKIVVNPILAIVERSLDYAAGKTPESISLEGTKEIEQLDSALQSMHDELTKDTEQLLESEERYRQVVTHINEVIVQIDEDEKWQFLSPVWEELAGFSLAESIGKPVSDFLLPSDNEQVSFILKSLISGKKTAWEGNVRLKRRDNSYIWVDLSLQVNVTKQSTKIINGTIENINSTRITLDINRLVRAAEQTVLLSNTSINALLELVTEELLHILNVSAVWVKVCVDKQSQILSSSGEVSGFLYSNKSTWSGLHDEGGPVIKCASDHRAVRVTKHDKLPPDWQQRLDNDAIKDSLFLPFYIGGDTQAVIGFHSLETNIFTEEIQSILVRFSEGLRLICKMVEDQNLMRLHRTAVEKTANSIAILDEAGTIEWVNDAFVKQTLFQADDVIGKKTTVFELAASESEKRSELWGKVQAGEVWSGELTHIQKGGNKIIVYQTVTPLINDLGDITHYIAMSEDITERKANQQRITFMATHDELTKLPNRNLLNDRLQQAIEHAKRNKLRMAVLFIDIDHFKYINDSLGHQIGDDLLQVLAVRLESVLRKEDTVARFGGDEFVIVLSEVAENNYIKSIANNLLNQIKKPYHIMEHELLITGSVGISIYPDDALNADNLIQQADSAMYSAKELGRNNSQFYTSDINEKITRRVTLEKALRQAVEQKQFVVQYQPKKDLMTNRITGVEALVRWQHPELGLVSPLEFIPLAEETGIIIELGRWVMETACKQMKEWEEQFPELINMSVNVSARQFWQDDFVSEVKQVLDESGVSRYKIEFELTETVVLDEVDLAIATMLELKDVGISLSIDDFGTGYSSLNYLQKLPVDVLKIDRTFITDMENDSADYAIVRSILALADNFKLKVVAEGIETEQQQHILTSLGCHYGQGYYLCVPMNADDITTHLAEQRDTQYSLWDE